MGEALQEVAFCICTLSKLKMELSNNILTVWLTRSQIDFEATQKQNKLAAK